MTSIVANALISAGQSEKLDLKEKISEIQKEIAKLKNDVKDFINDNYIEFVPTLKKDQALVVKAQKMVDEMANLEIRVRQQIEIELSGSTKELKDLSNALKESSLSLQLSSQLMELSESLKTIETHKKEKKYLKAARTLQRIRQILETPHSDMNSLNLYGALKNEYCLCNAKFLTDVLSLWKECILWQESSEPAKESTSLTIGDHEEIQELVRSLHCIGRLESLVASFAKDLVKYVIVPVVNYNEPSMRVINETTLTIEKSDKKVKPIYKSVLYYLKRLFQFLMQHLDVTIDNDLRFIVLLRKHLLEPFSKVLIKDCISDTIPSTSAELQDFEEVIKDINEFQDYLLEIGFIEPDQLFLSEYTKNVDNLFIEKTCQALLAKAIAISRKDLHDSYRHEPEEPLQLDDDQTGHCNGKIDRKLSKHTFQLPACQVSKSAKEMLNLAKEILEEACQSAEACAIRLFYTSRNVFEIYANTVPEYHKKFLETIPQQVALFHNNCMYLAHNLLSLAYEYKDRLPSHVQKHNITYADLVFTLRKVGSECFLNHMKYQRNIIIGIIRESGLAQLGPSPELPPSTERALRQCIRQLELLKTVWMDVLPVNIYCRAVGCIANTMVEDLVLKVITVEDISADVATELVTLFGMIVKRMPSIFPEANTIQRHVAKWSKLTELIKVLEASLKEIEDRWADGKGPLAKEFTANQVKQLIRALFQNTERRSNLLAIIK